MYSLQKHDDIQTSIEYSIGTIGNYTCGNLNDWQNLNNMNSYHLHNEL